jgi:hypothetical protein
MNPRKDRVPPGYNYGGPTLGHLLPTSGIVRIRDNLGPESKVLGPEIDGGREAEITLRERNKGRESGDGIRREMVRLDAEFLEKSPHEITHREPEAMLEMRDKNNKLTGLEIPRKLAAGQATLHTLRDPPCPAEPLNLVSSDI